MSTLATISLQDLQKIGFSIGRILSASLRADSPVPAYAIRVDFGQMIGEKISSAQLPSNYPDCEQLIGKHVIGVVNLPARKMGRKFTSEVLIVGFPDAHEHVQLLNTRNKTVAIGGFLSGFQREQMEAITYDVFSAADIRAATIRDISPQEGEETGYSVRLEIGNGEEIQATLSNLLESDLQTLVGTQVAVVVNLNNPLILCADATDGTTFPLGVDLCQNGPVSNGGRLF